jgi:hypothetical protein
MNKKVIEIANATKPVEDRLTSIGGIIDERDAVRLIYDKNMDAITIGIGNLMRLSQLVAEQDVIGGQKLYEKLREVMGRGVIPYLEEADEILQEYFIGGEEDENS